VRPFLAPPQAAVVSLYSLEDTNTLKAAMAEETTDGLVADSKVSPENDGAVANVLESGDAKLLGRIDR
jgi:hypothetical protein